MVRCKIPGENFGKLIEYKTVNTSTVAGIKEAENLKANGWTIGRSGFWDLQFFRYVEDETFLKFKASGNLQMFAIL